MQRGAFRRLFALRRARLLAVWATGHAATAVRLRSALAHLRRSCRKRRRTGHLLGVLSAHGSRDALRRAWSCWMGEAVRRLSEQSRLEMARATRAQEELSAQLARRQKAEEELRTLQVASSLWGEDELPAMLAHLAKAAENAEKSAAADAAADESAVSRRKDAAVAAAGWQGTQLRLTVSVLDSLKKELARERAELASARTESRASDSVAEQALGMLQALREEGAVMQGKLAALEEAKLRTEQALVRRDAEIFDLGRAQHQAARTLGLAVAQVEEKSFQALQRIEARCEARVKQLSSLQRRVSTVLEVRSDRRLDEWTRSLREPRAVAPSSAAAGYRLRSPANAP